MSDFPSNFIFKDSVDWLGIWQTLGVKLLFVIRLHGHLSWPAVKTSWWL